MEKLNFECLKGKHLIEFSSAIASEESVLNFVNLTYDLLTTHCSLIHSKAHDVYMVKTPNENYVFKVFCRDGLTKKTLDDITNITKLVNQKNEGLLQESIKTKFGTNCIEIEYPEGVRYGSLYKYIHGKEITHNTFKDNHIYGYSLGLLHQTEIKHRYASKEYYDLNLISEMNLTLKSKEKLCQVINWTLDNSYKLDGLKKGVIHGDSHGGNAIVNNGHLSFIDTDDLKFDYLAKDLMSFKLTCITNIGMSCYNNLLAGYLTVNPEYSISRQQESVLLWEREMTLLCGYFRRYSKLGSSLINDKFVNNRLNHLSQFLLRENI